MSSVLNKKFSFDDFDKFIKAYPKILELAEKSTRSPGDFVELLTNVGFEVLKRSESAILQEMETKLKRFVTEKNISLSLESLNSLDNLIQFLKQHNEVKKWL